MALYTNKEPENLPDQLRLARKLGVTPITIGAQGFDALINAGRVKWALTKDDKLLMIPKKVNGIQLHHPIISKGEPIQAAGEAEIAGMAGEYIGLFIDNHSGHYEPDPICLEIALAKFAAAGIDFAPQTIERIVY